MLHVCGVPWDDRTLGKEEGQAGHLCPLGRAGRNQTGAKEVVELHSGKGAAHMKVKKAKPAHLRRCEHSGLTRAQTEGE